jgi:hypothetical protein
MKRNCCEGFIDIILRVLKNILLTSSILPHQPYGPLILHCVVNYHTSLMMCFMICCSPLIGVIFLCIVWIAINIPLSLLLMSFPSLCF